MSDTKAIEAAESLDNISEVSETLEEYKSRLEAELRAEYESMIDKRITQALKTFQKKNNEAQRLLNEEAEAKRNEEREKYLAEAEDRERKLRLRNCRLILCDVIAENNLPGNLRNLIPCDDLSEIDNDIMIYKTLQDRVKGTWKEFNKLVKAEANKIVSSYGIQ